MEGSEERRDMLCFLRAGWRMYRGRQRQGEWVQRLLCCSETEKSPQETRTGVTGKGTEKRRNCESEVKR